MDRVETREQAIELAKDWAEGKRSHWNEIANMSDDRPNELAQCAVADAQEVVKLTALAQVLPTEDEYAVKHPITRPVRNISEPSFLHPSPDKEFSLLEFTYVNWKNQEYTYVIAPESLEYGHYSHSGRVNPLRWVINGNVVTRDGDLRPNMGPTRRRTFLVAKMRNIREIEKS